MWLLYGQRGRSLWVAVIAPVLLACASASADFVFGTPANLGPIVNSSARDEEPGISADGLSIYYCSRRSGGYGGYDMWVTHRASTQDGWGPPVNLGAGVNSSSDDFSEDISADGLELYFGSNRPGGSGTYDIWVARRPTTQDDWRTPVNLGPMVNSSSQEGCPSISADGLELYFWSNRPGSAGYDIWMSRRATTQDDWVMAENLGPTINSPAADLCTDVSPDGTSLILVSARAGGYGGTLGDLWLARRPTMRDPWGSPVNLGPAVNGPHSENGPVLSADGCTLYFSSDRPGGSGAQDMWEVSVSPVVDFTGDGLVNIDDLLRLIEAWGRNEPSADIAPTPFGDGIVDAADVEVLMSYWGQTVADDTLIACWPLDETAGPIARDSAGDHDATVTGEPLWRPDGGVTGGALEFDGVDGSMAADVPLDPKGGSFSILAWVKGGAPGQVIVSQADAKLGRTTHPGCSWLAIDSVFGTLTTELASSEFAPGEAQAVITDGQWHRVALAWDDSSKTSALYVDGDEVTVYVQPIVPTIYGGLRIGVGRSGEAGTFFSGLIDDVRIYNRAVRP